MLVLGPNVPTATPLAAKVHGPLHTAHYRSLFMSPPNVADLAVHASTSTKAEPDDEAQITRHVLEQTLCLHCSRSIYRYVYEATASHGESYSNWYHKDGAVAPCDWPEARRIGIGEPTPII